MTTSQHAGASKHEAGDATPEAPTTEPTTEPTTAPTTGSTGDQAGEAIGEPATGDRPVDEVSADRQPASTSRENRSARPEAAGQGSRSGNPVPKADVAAMFDHIAPVYDRMNTLMTLGSDGRWRRAAVNATRLSPGDAVIDVACGTGKLAGALADRVGPFGRVLAVDLAPGMIAEARQQNPDLVQLEFTVADALDLPVTDGTFDAATIAFGLRNLPDFEAAFRELARVVRPGGWIVCLELSVPRPKVWGRIYYGAFQRSAPLLGSLFGRRQAYQYLPRSLEGFPNPDELVRTMIRAGLVEVSYRRLALGAVALHKGRVPRQ
jgi:demethylmenaquinone methyltransferase / 2-methoxy-6-polyprenyl-1,4-benzoquinol methylase